MIPRLRTGGEKVIGGSIDRGIVQTTGLQTQNVEPSSNFDRHLAAARLAKAAFDGLAAAPDDSVISGSPRIRTAATGTARIAAKALPFARWQSLQWQFSMKTGSASHS